MQYLIERFNSQFVFNKTAVEKLVDKGEFDFINWDNAKSLYRLSNRKAQVCEMFQLGYEYDLMAPTKGYAIEKISRYAKEYKVQKVNNEFKQAEEELNSKILARKLECTSLYAMSLENKVAELEQQLKDKGREVNKLEQTVRIKDGNIADLDKEVKTLKTSLRQILRNNVVTKHAAKIAGKVAKVAQTEITITIK